MKKKIISIVLAILIFASSFACVFTIASPIANAAYDTGTNSENNYIPEMTSGMLRPSSNIPAGLHDLSDKIVSVTFTDDLNIESIKKRTSLYWDYSALRDNTVIAWAIKNQEESEKANKHRYDLFISADGGVIAYEDSSHLFANFSALKKVYNLHKFKTENVKSMRGMFSSCISLEKIDLSDLNTSNVTDMGYMFAWCKSLNNANINYIDVSNVENMEYFFYKCFALNNVDISRWDTTKVKDVNNMFSNCNSLKTIDLSEFNFINTRNYKNMFDNCTSLESIDFSNCNFDGVINWSGFLRDCTSLKTIYIYNINNNYPTYKIDENTFKNVSGVTINTNYPDLENKIFFTESFISIPDIKVAYNASIRAAYNASIYLNNIISATSFIDPRYTDKITSVISSNNSIVIIDNDYNIIPVATGSTTITAFLSTGENISFDITVFNNEEEKVEKEELDFFTRIFNWIKDLFMRLFFL